MTPTTEVAMEAAEEKVSDRRTQQRVALHLSGRYMLEDGKERPCECVDVSAGGIKLRATHSGPWGSRIIAYIDGIGRLEGYIVRRAPGWFAMATRMTPLKGERMNKRIAAILEQGTEAETVSDRRDDGREGAQREVWLFTLDGRKHLALMSDVSNVGAALLTNAALEIDERVRLDARRARVTRLFPGGAALKFENWVDESWPRREPAASPPSPRVRRA